MEADRPGGPLIHRNVDRELAAALAVEPSPEFLARVRMRIASEPDPSDRRLSWAFAAVGSCAIATVMAVALAQMTQMNLTSVPPELIGVPSLSTMSPSAHEKPTPEMQAIMQSNADAKAAMVGHLRDRNYAAIVGLAALYTQNFAFIEAFWVGKNVNGAVRISKRGRKAASDLAAAARAKDDAALEKAAASLFDTCGACHSLYREQLPDRTYAIKL